MKYKITIKNQSSEFQLSFVFRFLLIKKEKEKKEAK